MTTLFKVNELKARVQTTSQISQAAHSYSSLTAADAQLHESYKTPQRF